MSFNPADLGWISPYLILAAAGMLLVLAEAFYKGTDRTALVGLAVAGSLAATIASIVLYRQLEPGQVHPIFTDAKGGAMLVGDRLGYVLTAVFSLTTALTALHVARAPARARLADRRVLRPVAALGVGHGDPRAGDEPGDDLPRHRDDVDRRLRDVRDAPHVAPRQRGRDEVLLDRRVRDRLPDVRHGADLRRVGHAVAGQHARRARQDRESRPRDRGRVPARGRVRLQGRGGAVSHVGARRLRRRADAGDRLHGRRRSRPRRSRR